MGFAFSPGLSACDTSGYLVFLDTRKDRYFALTGAKRETCLALVADAATADHDPVIGALVAGEVLCRHPGDQRPVLCPPPPAVARSADAYATRATIGATASAIVSGLRVRMALRTRSLDPVLAELVRAKRGPVAGMPISRDPLALAAAFAAADRAVSALDRCLPRSIALARALVAAGIAPILVFGVKMRPFEAHCWVQHDDLLLSDDIATIAPFAPILLV